MRAEGGASRAGSPPMPEQEPWVPVVDVVAKHLGLARHTVCRWIEAKGLPAHRIGRVWKFKVTRIDTWVEAGGANDGSSADKTRGGGEA